MITYTTKCLINSRGVRAYIGDKIYLHLSLLSWIPLDKPYTIRAIHPDGTITFSNNISQHYSGIIDFELASRYAQFSL